ncbi:WYL domain-containing protein, partial [Sphaerisporangium rubeum]|uniref:WYL domain-containing protein n=1 Tax=Sphaerisporangium rubeum TaxID=321317 RepID=UPI0031DBD137
RRRASRTATESAGPPDADGWRHLRLPVESVRHAGWLLLRMGADLEVVGPAELRAFMAEAAAGLDALYNRPQS